MNKMQRAGGYAILLAGLQFVAILVIVFGVLAPQGVAGPDTPVETQLAVGAASPGPFRILNLNIALFSITLVLGALAVRERLQSGAPNRMRLAVLAASIGSALFLANGLISYSGLPPLAAAGDLIGFRVLNLVTGGLITSAIFAAGWMLFLWGWAGLSTKGLPAGLSYLLLLAGVVSILGFAVPIFGLLGVAINVLWAFWLGFVLMSQPAMAAKSKPSR